MWARCDGLELGPVLLTNLEPVGATRALTSGWRFYSDVSGRLSPVFCCAFTLGCHHGFLHHFRGSSLILAPPLATGTTQSDVASTDELMRVI